MYEEHGGEKCKYCNKTFSKYYIEEHIEVVHEKKKPHMCHICGEGFRRAAHLDVHISFVHEGTKPYKCDMCGQSFGTKLRKNKHDCFVLPSKLKNNQNKNDDSKNQSDDDEEETEKPFKCEKCDFKCVFRTRLQKHIALIS